MAMQPIVGRDRELAVTAEMLGWARADAAGMVIEGDPGIGKTSVWRSALESAAASGYRVLRCAGEQAEARWSFVGLNDLVGDSVDEVAPALSEPHREALEGALTPADAKRSNDARS